jgi:mannose-6-phosphate isomerase-like protein (cupin superfamily)
MRRVLISTFLLAGPAWLTLGAQARSTRPVTARRDSAVFVEQAARVAPKLPGLASRVDYVPVERFAQIRTLVDGAHAEGGTLFIAPDQQTSYMLLRRTAAGAVEEHSRWDDVLIVRSGRGVVELGPRTVGARVAAPGELRGGTLVEARRLVLRTGDVARIPAGVPHAFHPEGAEPWEVLVVKVRRPGKPLKGADGTP